MRWNTVRILKVIAIEQPFLISFERMKPINAFVVYEEDLFIYTNGQKIFVDNYKEYMDNVNHLIDEGRFEWALFDIEEGQLLFKDFDDAINVDETIVQSFSEISAAKPSRISDCTLKLFNNFLKECNKDSKDMCAALTMSFQDGYFRTEIDGIVAKDEFDKPTQLDKEIIVRCNLEGVAYITNYTNRLLESNKPDKFIDINYFFRRIFNLERFNYLTF